MKKEQYKYSGITGKIIGCAMKIHSALGCGFQEVIFQRALELELQKAHLEYSREVSIPIYYEGIEIGSRRVDFLVEGKVMVEVKAQSKLNDIHMAQIINYLEAFKLEVGLLINFGEKSLKFRRFINSGLNRRKR